MVTTQQLAAAQAFLASCAPANALSQRRPTQGQRSWKEELQNAQTDRHVARTALLEICVTRAVYQEAIAAAQAKNLV